MTRFSNILWLALLLPVAQLSAQQLEKVLPPAVPKLVPATTNAVPTITHFGAQEGEKVLLQKLTGIKFLSLHEQVITNGVALVGMDVSLVPLLQAPQFPLVMQPFLDRPASFESLQRITFATRTFLEASGYPFFTVYLPQQDITGGTVQVVVMAGKAGDSIKVEGAKYFSERLYRSAITQKPGEAINAAQLKKDIDWLNRNPFRNATVVAQPGGRSGTTDLNLRVNERLPFRANVGYNNTGTEVSAEDRLTTGFAWGNAFGLGHQMSYQFTTSPDFETSLSHSGSYAIDLPWRHSLRVTGAYSELEGRVLAPLTLHGLSWQVGLRYDIPLPRLSPSITQNFSFGFDFKASDNNVLFATIPVTDNLTHIAQLAVSYDVSMKDKWGRTDFGLNVFLSPGGVTSRNEDAFLNISRSGAEAKYAYLQLNASRQTRLPLGLNWSARGQFQTASGNLLGSEQMSGGGSGSVRGYEEGETYGDNGILFSHELALPSISLVDLLGLGKGIDSLQFYGFQDFTVLWNTDRLVGERHYTDLHSVGVGWRYNVRQNLSVNFAYGWQLRDSQASRSGDNSRAHLAVQLGF